MQALILLGKKKWLRLLYRAGRRKERDTVWMDDDLATPAGRLRASFGLLVATWLAGAALCVLCR